MNKITDMMQLGWSQAFTGRRSHLLYETEGERALAACGVTDFMNALDSGAVWDKCKRCLKVERTLQGKDHKDHDAGEPYPEEPDKRCTYIGNNMWSCGWMDGEEN